MATQSKTKKDINPFKPKNIEEAEERDRILIELQSLTASSLNPESLLTEEPKEVKWPKEDKEWLMKLWKIASPQSGELDHMMYLYRKYVNPNQPQPNNRGCANCLNHYSAIYNNFRGWFGVNAHKFE